MLVENLASKISYSLLLKQNNVTPTAESKWERLFYISIAWNRVWNDHIYRLTNNRKISSFMYKLVHGILPSGQNLKRWNLSETDECTISKVSDDALHVIFRCNRLNQFWNDVSTFCSNLPISNQSMDIEFTDILFGTGNRDVDVIIVNAAYVAFKTWCKYRENNNFMHLNVLPLLIKELKTVCMIENRLTALKRKITEM